MRLAQILRPLLAKREEACLLRNRELRPIDGLPGREVTIRGRRLKNFASNSYLGLSVHPRVVAALIEEANVSRYIVDREPLGFGQSLVHRELERVLAELKGTEAALLFGSGYQANVGVLQSLGQALGPNTLFLSDALNHASIVDGCRLAKARVAVYPHTDVDAVRKLARDADRVVIVTESRFSMDGDIAPLKALASLAEDIGAVLVVDEAHATGIDGEGRGLVHAMDLNVDLIVGTLGKAIGAHGAFAAGAREVIQWIENTARSFIYSTALSGPTARAALEAIAVLRDERPYERLRRNIELMRACLREARLDHAIVQTADGPIFPLVVGDPERAIELAKRLEDRGYLAVGIRPPTVPFGTSRVRISLRADHEDSDIRGLVTALEECTR